MNHSELNSASKVNSHSSIRIGWDLAGSLTITKVDSDQYVVKNDYYGDILISYQGEDEWEYKHVTASELIDLCYSMDFPCEWEPYDSYFYSLDSHGQVLGKRIDAMSPSIKELYNYSLRNNDSELSELIASQYGFSKKDIEMVEKGEAFDYEEIYPHLYVSKYGENKFQVFDTEYRTRFLLDDCCYNAKDLVCELKSFSENWIDRQIDDIRDLVKLRPEIYSCKYDIMDSMETVMYGLLLLSIRKGEKQIEQHIYEEYKLKPGSFEGEINEQLLTGIILEEPETIDDIEELITEIAGDSSNDRIASLLSFKREEGHLKGENYHKIVNFYFWDDIPDDVYKEIAEWRNNQSKTKMSCVHV